MTPCDTNEHQNFGKNVDTHIIWLRLSRDTIFKKFKNVELDFVLVRTYLTVLALQGMYKY